MAKIEIDLDLWFLVDQVVLASEELLSAIETNNSAGAVFFATYSGGTWGLNKALKGIGRVGFCYLKFDRSPRINLGDSLPPDNRQKFLPFRSSHHLHDKLHNHL